MGTKPSASFDSLPLELRQRIWDLTLKPRILCLHIHRRLAPLLGGPNGELLDGPMRTVAVSFTCSEFVASSTNSSHTAEGIFASFAQKVYQKHKDDGSDWRMGSLTGPTPLGPVALYVCRESREIAIQRYCLAFRGTNIDLDGNNKASWEQRSPEDKAEWDRCRLSDRGIWVDFSRDIIFVDGHFRLGLYSKCSPVEPMNLIRTYAPVETSNIKRLAIGAVSGRRRDEGYCRYRFEMQSVIEGDRFARLHDADLVAPSAVFTNVEELLLDDTIGEDDGFEPHPAGSPNIGRYGWDEEAMKSNIIKIWESKRGAALKLVEFVRGDAWNDYIWP